MPLPAVYLVGFYAGRIGQAVAVSYASKKVLKWIEEKEQSSSLSSTRSSARPKQS